ncbi:hypothetical protein BGX34_007243 [Mortierella sp. NVP85]|nr:hypothetical protein BGX34_007243 [Mortierella sp. NVP85]
MLFKKLFFFGRKSNYDRQTTVAASEDEALLNKEFLIGDEQLDALKSLPASSNEYKASKESIKVSLKQHVKNLNPMTRFGKFVLTGVMATNGHDLRIHAYPLNTPKGS